MASRYHRGQSQRRHRPTISFSCRARNRCVRSVLRPDGPVRATPTHGKRSNATCFALGSRESAAAVAPDFDLAGCLSSNRFRILKLTSALILWWQDSVIPCSKGQSAPPAGDQYLPLAQGVALCVCVTTIIDRQEPRH